MSVCVCVSVRVLYVRVCVYMSTEGNMAQSNYNAQLCLPAVMGWDGMGWDGM